MIKKTKIKASAIQYALVLIVVMALLLGGLVLFSGATRKIQTQFQLQEEVRFNAYSGIEYGKAFANELSFNKPTQIILFERGIDSVEVTKKTWGAYQVIVSKAFHRSTRSEAVAMIGHLSENNQPSLYLADLGNPLGLCGKTKISGQCELPKRGVKRTYIAGQNYIGDKLIYGTTTTSKAQLPEVNQTLLNQIHLPVLVTKRNWESEDSIVNSFVNEPLYYYESGSISIDANYIQGQVIIESDDSIFVSRLAQLDQVILKSPVVYFESGFEGSVQVFASHKITLEEDVTLLYPSVLSVIETNRYESISGIELGEGSRVLGSIFLTSETPDFRKEILLDIQEKAAVYGLAYCNGKTQLKGKVNGQLLTKKFYLKTPSSAYENHLLNAEIINDLPADFAVIPLLGSDQKYKTVSWLK